MSKYVAFESNEDYDSHKRGRKRGDGDEGDEDEEGNLEVPLAESLTTLTTVSTAPPSWITKLRKLELCAELNDRFVKYEKKDNKSVLIELLRLRLRCEILLSGNNFLNTDDFRRLLPPFLPDDELMSIMLVSKPWSRVADGFISDGVESGAMMVHDGKDISEDAAEAQEERRELVARVIFLLNITQVGQHAICDTINLVFVDIPEGVLSIGDDAFGGCDSLTAVSFPTTLTSIGEAAFAYCSSLENVDLLHTNLQELGRLAFGQCSELKSMAIPDSLQTLGDWVFLSCDKLVPPNMYNDLNPNNTILTYLRAKQNASQNSLT
ncbi:hypothetical protein TL16_g00536 [Triparma laevis f. inornata]|uniref:Uncharacterized protein n=1 Tax=Triparma laevis f. inornata TaxID=1714386 RepID=A0A9W7DSW1_9STRA|nr:hypothetical protein TL16_g00536 [Triparma laevis f. inornata]